MTLTHLQRSTPKKLYSVLKQDSRGISSLKANGKTLSSQPDKANALNLQFQSVFSPKSPLSQKSLAPRTLQDLHDSGTDLPFQSSPHSLTFRPQQKELHASLKSLTPIRQQVLTRSNQLFYRPSIKS